MMLVRSYLVAVFALQLAAGILLLANRFVPIALVLLGPVLVNVLLFHVTMAPAGLPMAVIVTALWVTVFFSVRKAFAGIFVARVAT